MGLDFDFSIRLKCITGYDGVLGDLILRLLGLHISNGFLRYDKATWGGPCIDSQLGRILA